MGEHGNVGRRDDVKLVVVDCPNGMSYIGQSAYGSGTRKGENLSVKIINYVIVRTDGLMGEVMTSGKSFEVIAKAEYQSKLKTANPGTFSPGPYVVGIHNLDEHL